MIHVKISKVCELYGPSVKLQSMLRSNLSTQCLKLKLIQHWCFWMLIRGQHEKCIIAWSVLVKKSKQDGRCNNIQQIIIIFHLISDILCKLIINSTKSFSVLSSATLFKCSTSKKVNGKMWWFVKWDTLHWMATKNELMLLQVMEEQNWCERLNEQSILQTRKNETNHTSGILDQLQSQHFPMMTLFISKCFPRCERTTLDSISVSLHYITHSWDI